MQVLANLEQLLRSVNQAYIHSLINIIEAIVSTAYLVGTPGRQRNENAAATVRPGTPRHLNNSGRKENEYERSDKMESLQASK